MMKIFTFFEGLFVVFFGMDSDFHAYHWAKSDLFFGFWILVMEFPHNFSVATEESCYETPIFIFLFWL